LYARGRAEPEEEGRILHFGLSLHDEAGTRYFALPCPQCSGGRCGIYEQRFTKCRTFRCKLLKAYQAGELEFREASERVRTALKLRDAVTAEEPAAALLTERIRIRREVDPGKRRARLLLNMAALDYYLDMHFRNKDPQVLRDDQSGTRTEFSEKTFRTIRS
jgi:hypothetical protein